MTQPDQGGPGTRATLFIAACLAVQVAVPVAWYLTPRDDYDPRFAWRMFTSTAHVECRPTATVDGAPVDLVRRFGHVWHHRLEGGWRFVLDAVTERLCAGGDARVTLQCVEVTGRRKTLVGPPCAG